MEYCELNIIMSSTTNSTLRDKLTNVPLISYIDEELYMKLLITKNNQTQIGLYTKVPNRRDKHLYWVSDRRSRYII